jgi:hypothetical protein
LYGDKTIHLWNRSGNVASWNNSLAFFAASYERIHTRIRVLGVIADSVFYLKQFIETLKMNTSSTSSQRGSYDLYSDRSTRSPGKRRQRGFPYPSSLSCIPDGAERRYIVVWQNIIRRKKAMGKTLPLFANELASKTTVTAPGSPIQKNLPTRCGQPASPGG